MAMMARGGEPPEAARLLEEGWGLFRAREYAKATEIFLKAVPEAERAGDRSLLVECLSMAARGHLVAERRDEGLKFLDRAKALARPEEPRGWSTYLGVRGRFEWQGGDKPGATKTFEEMYDFCCGHDLFDRAIDAAHMVAITGTLEQQVEWGRKGIAAAEKGGNDSWLGPLWNNLGNTYLDLGKPQEAVEAFLKARPYHWKNGTEMNKLIADWAIGMALRKSGEPAKAAQWLRPVLAWAERLYAIDPAGGEHEEWIGLALLEMGRVEADLQRNPEALALLERAHKHLQTAKMPEWDAKGFQELSAQIEKLRAGGK